MVDGSRPRTDPAFSGNVQVFTDYLTATGQPFLVLGKLGGQQVHVRFVGQFEGRDVVWDCRFLTLQAEAEHTGKSSEHHSAGAQRCFIEIGRPGINGIRLRVGLNLAAIDAPSIQKMIIMIRNYRRLRQGRYEFGGPGALAT